MTFDLVHDSRVAFDACMRALCAPGEPIELAVRPALTSVPELDSAAAILLALLDRGLGLAVAGGSAARDVGALVAARSGAALGEVGDADWILVHGPAADAISCARRGTRETPERGATLVIAATSAVQPVRLAGPGVPTTRAAYVALDTVAVHAFTAANAAGPCGVDVFIVDGDSVVALPRSVSLMTGAG